MRLKLAILGLTTVTLGGCAAATVTETQCNATRNVDREIESGRVSDWTGKPFIEGIDNEERQKILAACDAARL